MKSFLVAAQAEESFQTIQKCYGQGYKVDKASSAAEAITALQGRRYDFILIDLQLFRDLGGESGSEAALEGIWRLYPTIEVIIMSPPESIREVMMAVKAGASNYLTYPLNPEEVKYVIETTYGATILQSELDYLRGHFWQLDSLALVHTKSDIMQKVFEKVRSVAPTKSTVLLFGETGTGKGVLAQLIHKHSNRRNGPFINVHCGAIPDTLLESELFGHEKGSFTGAIRRKLGKFEIAKGGTIVLDEIGTVTPSAQIKLLQVLQDGTFHRVGGEESIETDARVIAATNTVLEKACEDGRFRKDLFYRLNVFPIEVPPLRERREDIPHLVEEILEKLNRFHLKGVKSVHPAVVDALERYSWPGNIRELENMMERAYILESSPVLSPGNFPSEILSSSERSLAAATFDSSLTLTEARKKGLEDFEKNYLTELLAQNKGRIKNSAQTAGISTRQLHKLMKKYGLQKEYFRKASN